jgi:hypothetical protein
MSAPAGSVMFVPRIIPIDLPNNASVKFSHLILPDAKFPRQIFNFAKCSIHVALSLGSIMNCRTKSSILPFVVILSDSVRVFFLCSVAWVSRSIVILPNFLVPVRRD